MRLSRNDIRYLKSTGRSIAKVGGKAATGLTRWATTEHTGLSQRLSSMPNMGFIDAIKFIFLQLAISIFAAIATGVFVFILIAYGIPLLISCLQ